MNKGDRLWILEDGKWEPATYEFRCLNNEPLGQHSVMLESGGGRRVVCGCKTRTEAPVSGRAVSEKREVFCVEDSRARIERVKLSREAAENEMLSASGEQVTRYLPEPDWLTTADLIVYPDENAPAWVDVRGELFFGRWRNDWSAWKLENGNAVRMGNVTRFSLVTIPRNGV